MTQNPSPGVIERTSSLSFDDTLEHLVEVITQSGMTIFARIDHAAQARSVGLTMPPATVLIYGNPIGGTPIMLAAPLVALDLPLRVLVGTRENGAAVIAFHPIEDVLLRAGVAAEIATSLEPAQHLLLKGLAS